jgi:putative transposase
LAEAYKSNFQKKKKDPTHQFDIKFRSKKAGTQSITIPHDAIKSWDATEGTMSMYPKTLTNKIKFHLRTRSQNVGMDNVAYDCKLTLDRLGRFHLCIPQHVPVCETQTDDKRHEWCAGDPGVRTLMTVYSPKPGVCYKLADGDTQRLFRLCKGLDELISQTATAKCKKKHNMKKAQVRMRLRIKHLVDEVHWKTIRFLLDNFKNIIIPPFAVSQMVKKANRKIRSTSVRQMLCWRHFAFRTRLLQAAQQVPGAKVHVRTEEYTSKTCTHCGNIKHDLGGAKSYRCSQCHLMADRDVNGSRNIFIKNASG